MRVASAEFVRSVVDLNELPASRMPEIAWAGRSNAGKSSLINALTGRRSLARTSNTPGKTRKINFYVIDSSWHLVDLPGYGYVAAAESDRIRWQALIEPYLERRTQLCGVVVLVDSKVGPTELDQTMIEWLTRKGRNFAVAISKADRIRDHHAADLAKSLRGTLPETVPVFITSAKQKQGLRELEGWILGRLSGWREETPVRATWHSETV
ncbi:MAG: putative GTP-binding protein EngB [Candidatus Latescibacteria bacterium ADurb.Bin168]|nr:MAG: putative GTP-binding protein EngB [Candidatus Latescibacteria bacterium ADurb.Bin168]